MVASATSLSDRRGKSCVTLNFAAPSGKVLSFDGQAAVIP
jgi:hypothetical protein